MDGAELTTHFLEELSVMEKTMEGSEEMQKMFIKRLQKFLQDKEPWSNRIRELPFPAAMFARSGVLTGASRKLMQNAGITSADLAAGRINFLNRITTENSGVLDAAGRVFAGGIGVAGDLVAPISMFVKDDDVPDYQGGYQSALFFPVCPCGCGITCGAVVLLQQKVVIQDQEE